MGAKKDNSSDKKKKMEVQPSEAEESCEPLEELSDEEVENLMEEAAVWADNAVYDAVTPLIQEASDAEDFFGLGALGPSLVAAGVSIAVGTMGQEEAISLLKDMIESLESGEFEGPFELYEGDEEDAEAEEK